MADLNSLKGNELSAAMRGGTEGWGRQASSADNVRYSVKITGRGRRSICSCGCKNKATDIGMANGLGLTSGCEFSVALWVRTGKIKTMENLRRLWK